MALIDPNQQKKFERNPEEGNIPTGLYLCELTEVRETGPSSKFPGGNNRLIFEFTIVDGPCKGKKTVAFIGKTLLKSKEGRESNLVKWARMMGVVNPELGFDPDTLLRKRFNVMVEFTAGTNGESGRGWARQAIVAGGAAPAASPPPQAPAAPKHDTQGAGNPAAMWDIHDGTNGLKGQTTAQVQAFIQEFKLDAAALKAKPAGAPVSEARPASEWGFASADLIPW